MIVIRFVIGIHFLVFLLGKFSHVISLRSNQFDWTGFEPNFEKYVPMHT